MNFAREKCDRRATQSRMRGLQPGIEYSISERAVNDRMRKRALSVAAIEMRGPSFGLRRRLTHAVFAAATGRTFAAASGRRVSAGLRSRLRVGRRRSGSATSLWTPRCIIRIDQNHSYERESACESRMRCRNPGQGQLGGRWVWTTLEFIRSSLILFREKS